VVHKTNRNKCFYVGLDTNTLVVVEEFILLAFGAKKSFFRSYLSLITCFFITIPVSFYKVIPNNRCG
jgi:hypothetical protein